MGQPQVEASPRLTSLSHGGGCGCKIAPGLLKKLLANMPETQAFSNLLVGTETGDDAAVYQLNNEQALVATTDFFMPIVDDPFDFGRIAATNALSDVYAMGAKPIMALALVGMPINVMSHDDIAAILEGGARAASEAGIPIAGGHSIDSVEPIYGLAAMGLVHPKKLRRNADAQAGDVLILGKGLGVGILSAALKKQQLSAQGYAAMLDSTTRLNTPGIALAEMPGVHAITDVTGFGVLGHTLEVAKASGLDATLQFKQLPLLDGVLRLAREGVVTGASARNFESYGANILLAETLTKAQRALLTDPQTSGGLLVACAADAVSAVLEVFHAEGFTQASVIGSMQKPLGSPTVMVV